MRGADQLHAVLLQDAGRVQRHRGVERGLAAERGEQRVGALLLDHLLDELRRDRLDVRRVRELRVGHDRGRVGVDQDHPDALGLEHPAGLGAGVVELAGLADDDRPGADHQDGLDVVALRHQTVAFHQARRTGRRGTPRRAGRRRPRGGTGPRTPSARPSASRSSSPSTTSSLRQTWLTVATPYGVSVAASSGRVDREAVVVRGDLDLAGGAVHDRLVDAAVAVLELVGAEARAPGRTAGCRSRSRSRGCPAASAPCSSSTWLVVAAGSPGPLEKNSPSGADRAARRRGSRWPAARAPRCRARPSGAGSSP